jgi:hypothetical protein
MCVDYVSLSGFEVVSIYFVVYELILSLLVFVELFELRVLYFVVDEFIVCRR